ncbi:hypothetical protein BBK82_08835 [Lentzea guizhouensis]|uniref:PLD phosphodiesterase domain-containing protein n=1 Tax=Lentzea guizhouensis TaxID=1586287 RepID=A0A1B2HEL0_9PSEU|nr:hypothetical protein BBK82_08835 [Lentzea guizhouensis]
MKLGFAEALTPIEKIVLKAVHAGVRTLGDLAAVLGLPQRMLVDIAQDLWRAKYLLVVRTRTGVRVSDEVAHAITTNSLDKLKSAEVVDTTRNLMVDKLTNEIRPVLGRDNPGQRRFAVPVENRLTRLGELTNTDLLVALELDLANEAKRNAEAAGSDTNDRQGFARNARVLSAHLAGNELASVGRRWLPVEVRPTVDPLDDALTVTVVDDQFSDAQRAAANEQLSRLISARPNDDFVRALRGQAPPGLVEALSLADGVARLRGQAEAAATIPAGQRRNWHFALADHARRLDTQLVELTEREVDATAVIGRDHTDVLLNAIRSARTQLVITAPWMSYTALAAVAPALRAALERGVDIFLLWGISHDQTVDGRVNGLLYDMVLRNTKSRSAGKLHVPGSDTQNKDEPISGSSRTHAKIVIIDDERAFVTSWNMLNKPDPSQEVGVLLAGIENGPCIPVRELLKWARSIVPDYRTSNQMLVTENDFALRRGLTRSRDFAGQPERQDTANGTRRHPQPSEPDDGEGQAAEIAARTWSKAWVEHANQIGAKLADRANADGLIVVDGTHRELLKRALRQARFRLAITSDQLSSQVVDDRFIGALRGALERGVEVAISYKRSHRNDSPVLFSAGGPVAAPPTRAESALAAVEAEFPEQFHLERVDLHAKVLVCDDLVVIGSFNFLSFEGFFNTGAAYRRQSEVSVQVTSPRFADEVAHQLGLTSPRPATAVAALPKSEGIYLTVQRILNEVEPTIAVAEHLTTAADPWTVLDHLAEDAERSLLRVAASACLLQEESGNGHAGPKRWARWLVEDLWSDGRFVEALLLRHLTREDELSPRLPVAVLAAARGTSAYPAALGNALSLLDAESDDTPRRRAIEVATLLVSAVEQVVFIGGKDAQDTLELLLSEIEGAASGEDDGIEPWKVLGETALQYAAESFGIALPVEAIKCDLSKMADSDDKDRAWDRLSTAFDRAEHTHFESTPSLRTHLYLFTNPKGHFTQLKDILTGRRSAALAQWLAEPKLGNLNALINAATATASPGDPLMHGTYLKRYVRLLESVIAEAEAVVARWNGPDDETGPDLETQRLLTAARPLAEVVMQKRPDLLAFIEQCTEPEARFLTSVVESFDELAVWAGGKETGD